MLMKARFGGWMLRSARPVGWAALPEIEACGGGDDFTI